MGKDQMIWLQLVPDFHTAEAVACQYQDKLPRSAKRSIVSVAALARVPLELRQVANVETSRSTVPWHALGGPLRAPASHGPFPRGRRERIGHQIPLSGTGSLRARPRDYLGLGRGFVLRDMRLGLTARVQRRAPASPHPLVVSIDG